MYKKLRKKWVIVSTTLLSLQMLVFPVGQVLAQMSEETQETTEQSALPEIDTYFPKDETVSPRFFFAQSRLKGTVGEPLKVTVLSDQEVAEVQVKLPKEAQILTDQLPVGLSIQPGELAQEWWISTISPQKSFVLPVIFEETGSYEVVVEGESSTIEVYEEDREVEHNQTLEEEYENLESLPNTRSTTWNMSTIKNFPLTMNYQEEILRPELIPDNYHIVEARKSSLPIQVGWRTATGINLGVESSFTVRNYIFPNIPTSNSEEPIDLFYNVSQSFGLITQGSTGWLFRNTINSSVTANVIARYKDGTTSENPLFMTHQTSTTDTHHILKGDLIGIGIFGTNANINNTSITIRETATHYTISYHQSVSGVIGIMLRNGAQHRVTSINRYGGYGLFQNFSSSTVPSRTLHVQSSPVEGGVTVANKTSLFQGENTDISASSNKGFNFIRWEILSGTGSSIADVHNSNTTFTMGSSNTVVEAIYEREVEEDTPAIPVDPLDPEKEVDPENKPDLPEDQGLLSIDFASTFNFGAQAISPREETYYAKPQRLLNEDGTVNEDEERPNYVQISDRRPENERNGWQLAVTQNGQFETQDKEPLLGARLSFTNQALATAQGGILPELQQTNPLTLVPGVKRVLVMAQGDEGAGTWIYRFGDQETAGESIGLTVPQGANPKAAQYTTTLTWELSAVPGNE